MKKLTIKAIIDNDEITAEQGENGWKISVIDTLTGETRNTVFSNHTTLSFLVFLAIGDQIDYFVPHRKLAHIFKLFLDEKRFSDDDLKNCKG